MPSSTSASTGTQLPSLDEIRQQTMQHFGRRPCLWQCESALAQLRGDKDIVCISGTGSGKTLTFWMPLLFRPEGIQVVITPLNILGNQNQKQLERLGITAVAMSGETATPANFKAIENLEHRVIIVSLELAFQPNGAFSRLWKNAAFVSRLIGIIWDEAHCISSWSSFRADYGDAGRLRAILPRVVPYLLPSATLPPHVLNDVLENLQLRREWILVIHRSNDRPNVYLTVRKIAHALTSFKDLEFLVPDSWEPGVRIPWFLVFFDNIEDSVKAAAVLQRRVSPAYRKKIVWFNSDCTPAFREYATTSFLKHTVYGLYCTDAFGMGIDIPDIEVVVQWRVTCDMDSLWQRFGRAARGPGTEAIAVLFAEAKYFNQEKESAAKRSEDRKHAAEKKSAEMELKKRKRSNDDAKRIEVPSDSIEPEGADVINSTRTHRDTAAREGPAALTEYEQLRVSYRQARPACLLKQASREKSRGQNKQLQELSAEMDNLVNASTRRFKCYRTPITAFYGNDALASDHRACQSEGEGCSRCLVPPSSVCCSLCSPDHSLFAVFSIPLSDKTALPRASQIETRYKMTSTDIELRRALHAFRRSKTLEVLGKAHLQNLGTGMIMGDEVLGRIADCARAGKLPSPEALARETKWNRALEFAQDVLQLVNS
ncbi:P-loop containing nucleoside triphosphate hydrolase protein [Trametes meyenii]|nr:P-loop containing nucleoside triphosphate hydrolase protein [Trametes meyenii]